MYYSLTQTTVLTSNNFLDMKYRYALFY